MMAWTDGKAAFRLELFIQEDLLLNFLQRRAHYYCKKMPCSVCVSLCVLAAMCAHHPN